MLSLACALSSASVLQLIIIIINNIVRQGGNNNTYCHDSPLNWFNWDLAGDEGNGFARFYRSLIHFRRAWAQGRVEYDRVCGFSLRHRLGKQHADC